MSSEVFAALSESLVDCNRVATELSVPLAELSVPCMAAVFEAASEEMPEMVVAPFTRELSSFWASALVLVRVVSNEPRACSRLAWAFSPDVLSWEVVALASTMVSLAVWQELWVSLSSCEMEAI